MTYGPKVGLWGARADFGGLAAMTYEFHRHLWPARTMIINMGPAQTRGRFDPGGYRNGEIAVNDGYNNDISVETVRWFCQGLDVVYFAETTYREDFCAVARQAGVRTVGHIMPELYRAADCQPDRLWVPTCWQIDRMPPGTAVVPVPVPTDTFTPAPKPGGALLHPTAKAFHDRNGTNLTEAALGYAQDALRVVYSGPQRPPERLIARSGRRVTLGYITGTDDRREQYPAECGALLIPRRYAGLSLPMQEAAGLGWPIITLDLPPQNLWVHPDTLALPERGPDVRMVGGVFNVADASPRQLGAIINRLYHDPGLWDEAGRLSRVYAEQNSWDNQSARYRELLAEAAA